MRIDVILANDVPQLVSALTMSAAEARFEIQLLLAHVLRVNRAWLIAHADEVLSTDNYTLYQHYFRRRLQAEPIAYIFGEKEFYGMVFKVTPDVLIPRPDTELLVSSALSRIPVNSVMHILDLGTGSGAIAISVASLRPLAQVVAVDKSQAALAVAQANAVRLGVENISFLASDWWQQLPGDAKFDIIISNPPYIAEQDVHLLALGFEPASALTAGVSGLDDLRFIIASAPNYLNRAGYLLLEHGYNQAHVVSSLLDAAGFVGVKVERDLGGVERVSLGQVT